MIITWQNILLAGVGVAFFCALVPQVVKGFRMKQGLVEVWTSLITFLGLLVYVVVFYSLGVYVTVVSSFLSCVCWLILLIQRIVWGDIEKERGKPQGVVCLSCGQYVVHDKFCHNCGEEIP